MFLIGGGDERSPHFQPVFDVVDQFIAEGEDFGVVYAGAAHAGDDFVCSAHAVGSGDSFFRRVPHDEVVIVLVVWVSIAGKPGAFSNGTECDFPLYADFVQKMGDLLAFRCDDLQPGAAVCIKQVLVCGQRVDFLL